MLAGPEQNRLYSFNVADILAIYRGCIQRLYTEAI